MSMVSSVRASRALLVLLWVSTSCVESEISPNPDHCTHKAFEQGMTGSQWCIGTHGPEYRFCSQCSTSEGDDGCTTVRPEDERCLSGAEGSTGTTETSTDPSSGSDPSDSSETEQGCGVDALVSECAQSDPGRPICHQGQCVPCDDEVCAAIDESTASGKPVCAPGAAACVECTPHDERACAASSEFCSSSYQCGGCTRHDQCDSRACDLKSGTCIEPGNVWWVDNDPGCGGLSNGSAAAPFCSFTAALTAAESGVEADEAGAIMVVGGHDPYDALDLSAGSFDFDLAIIGRSIRPRFRSDATTGYVIAAHPGTHLYLENLDIVGTRPGVRCPGGPDSGLWLDGVTVTGVDSGSFGAVVSNGCRTSIRRSSIHDNAGTGVFADGDAEVLVESSFITNHPGAGIELQEAQLDLVYSTVIGRAGPGLHCTGVSGHVRNSIVVGVTSGALSCSGVTAGEDEGNVTNTTLGGEVTLAELTSWFPGIEYGDLHLSHGGRDKFADRATWTLGDSLYDIDGQLRPGIDGGPTYTGADQ